MMILQDRQITVVTPGDIAGPLQDWLRSCDAIDRDREHLIVVAIDCRLAVSGVEVVGIGLSDRVLFHPREVFRRAITLGAHKLIVAHNHPSGNCNPSLEDEEVYKRMCQAGDVLGITILDHLIFTTAAYYSLETGQTILNPVSCG